MLLLRDIFFICYIFLAYTHIKQYIQPNYVDYNIIKFWAFIKFNGVKSGDCFYD